MAQEIEQVFLDIVDTAIAITEADFGNIQLLDPTTGDLKIVAQRGFSESWQNYWNSVSKGKVQSAFDTALQKENWSGVMQRIRKNGTYFNAFVTITSRKNANNTVIGYTLISRDLTDMENVLEIINWLKASEDFIQIEADNLELLPVKVNLINVMNEIEGLFH